MPIEDTVKQLVKDVADLTATVGRLTARNSSAGATRRSNQTDAGWYRFAQYGGDPAALGMNANGLFEIRWMSSAGYHGSVLVFLAAHYHGVEGVGVHLVGHSTWAGAPSLVDQVRIVIHPTLDTTFYAEFSMSTDVASGVQFFVRRVYGSGWSGMDLITGSVPSGYSSVARSVPTNTTWQAPTLQNGWLNYDTTTFNPVGYLLDRNGIVHLRGLIKSGTTVNPTLLFTVPTTYRPTKTLIFPVMSNAALGECRVDGVGSVFFISGSNAWYSLDGITYPTY